MVSLLCFDVSLSFTPRSGHQGFGHAVLILPLEEIVTVLRAHDLHDFSGLVDFSAPHGRMMRSL